MSLTEESINNEVSHQSASTEAPRTTIPHATYRLNFNKSFTFKHAIQIVPYLASLGVSHCYASPILQAKPGSMHGYDIVDYSQINSDIGTMADLYQLVNNLRQHNMGLILDIVPNHMGIGYQNRWWYDVLETGPLSAYSEYFDIDWHPLKTELNEKVLLPILGKAYGQALADGEIKLNFASESGSFYLQYFDHILPINPMSYPLILSKCLPALEQPLNGVISDSDEFISILNGLKSLSYLPFENFALRLREQQTEKHRLANLCNRNPQIKQRIEASMQEFAASKSNCQAQNNLHNLLEQQSYRLSFWRVSSDEINYRRFFDIDSLAAVRTEDARVFSAMHHLIFKLISEKQVDGLRIDHPDGLYNPYKYFDDIQIQAAKYLSINSNTSLEPVTQNIETNNEFNYEFASIYIVVEKILAPFEHLPTNWKVHGTTGYDYLNASIRLLVDTEASPNFDQIYAQFIGYTADISSLKLDCKELILRTLLASELNVLAQRLSRLAESNWNYRDFTLGSLRSALRQVVKFFPVYRTYVTDLPIDKASRTYIEWAVSAAKKASSPINARIFDFIKDILTLDILTVRDNVDSTQWDKTQLSETIKQFVLKFQQYTGPLMAKSIEDTFFYRYNRFVCLNDVGGEPEKFGSTINAFHLQNQQRQLNRPFEMTTTSTHDTKRSEDARARLAAISEIPDIWKEKVLDWQEKNKVHKTIVGDQSYPDNNDEYMIYQNLIGILPPQWNSLDHSISPEDINHLKERIQQYALKAIREAKVYTSWIDQNENYERYVSAFIDKILHMSTPNTFLSDILTFHRTLSDFGLINSLVQTVLKFTSPGVPDLYQGCETWNFTLVDPDNRQPIAFEQLISMLTAIEQNSHAFNDDGMGAAKFETQQIYLENLIETRHNGLIKLFITKQCLDYRSRYKDLFTKGIYTPLKVIGPAENNILAFLRKWSDDLCVVVVPLKVIKLAGRNSTDSFYQGDIFKDLRNKMWWANNTIMLPEGVVTSEFRDLLSNQIIKAENGSLKCEDIFESFPTAVLMS